jgi:hypothetical protein
VLRENDEGMKGINEEGMKQDLTQARFSSRPFNFQFAKKFAEGTKHTLIQGRLAR